MKRLAIAAVGLALVVGVACAVAAAGVLLAQSRTEVAAHIEVAASSDHPIQVDVTSLDFGTVQGGNETTRTFHITNPSTTTAARVELSLEGNFPSSTNYWWFVRVDGQLVAPVIIPPTKTATVDFTFKPSLSTPEGDYNFTIVVLSTDAP
jgi:hypothetical protein